jgi:hypothetical protein
MKRYTLDPTQIGLERFKQLTRDRKMLPSRILLQQQIDQRFAKLHAAEILTLGDLLHRLRSHLKLEAFSKESGISREYLLLLKREAGSYLAKPFPLSNFPGIPFEYTEVLKSKGLKNTRDFYEGVRSAEQNTRLSQDTGIPLARLMELNALCDLSRITGVGGVFARVVYEAGIRSSNEFALTNAPKHYQLYMAVIDKYGYTAGHFSEEDIRYCIQYAKVIREVDNGHTE